MLILFVDHFQFCGYRRMNYYKKDRQFIEKFMILLCNFDILLRNENMILII